MPRKEIQEHLGFFRCPCVKGSNWFSYITHGKIYCQSSRRLSVLETSLPCGLVVHINLVIACFVQASDNRLLKMRIDHHNQQLLRLINRLFPIIGTSLLLTLLFALITNIFYSPKPTVPLNFWRKLYLVCIYGEVKMTERLRGHGCM